MHATSTDDVIEKKKNVNSTINSKLIKVAKQTVSYSRDYKKWYFKTRSCNSLQLRL